MMESPAADVTQFPTSAHGLFPIEQLAPAWSPEHAATEGETSSCARVHASTPVPAGPRLHTPVKAFLPPVVVHDAPATFSEHAAVASADGVSFRPQINVALLVETTHTPSRVLPSLSVTVHAAPAVSPLHADSSSAGGAGEFGAHATVAPSMVVRQVPLHVWVPSDETSVQASPAARPAHTSICVSLGVQTSVPAESVVEA